MYTAKTISAESAMLECVTRRSLRDALILAEAILCMLFACACGNTDVLEPDTDAPGVIRASPVVNTTCPKSLAMSMFGSHPWSVKAGQKSIYFVGADHTKEPAPGKARGGVRFVPDGTITGVKQIRYADETYLLVATNNEATGVATVARFHDEDDDDVPDVSTRTELLDFGSTPVFITSLDMTADGSMLLALDRRCQDILLVTDSDDDGWPDTLASSRWALSKDIPALDRVQEIRAGGDPMRVAGYLIPLIEGRSPPTLRPILILRDDDDDGVAEFVHEPSHVRWSIASEGAPFDGATSVRVTGGCKDGSVVEIWNLDENGQADVLLGSQPIGKTATLVGVDPMLEERQRVRIKYAGRVTPKRDYTVVSAVPQVLGVSPRSVKSNSGTRTITINGLNLDVLSSVEYRDSGTSIWTTATSRVLSPTQATFEFTTPSTGDIFYVRAISHGQDMEREVPASAMLMVVR